VIRSTQTCSCSAAVRLDDQDHIELEPFGLPRVEDDDLPVLLEILADGCGRDGTGDSAAQFRQ
jgi:hypothetical protein